MSIVKEAHRELPAPSKRWKLVLDCGHFATVIVGHVPALGGRYNCGLCAAPFVHIPREQAVSIIVNAHCRDCLGKGLVHLGDNNTGRDHECTSCATKTALAFLLTRIGSWSNARWDQHVRYEYGDDVANAMVRMLAAADIPLDAFAASPSSSHESKEKP